MPEKRAAAHLTARRLEFILSTVLEGADPKLVRELGIWLTGGRRVCAGQVVLTVSLAVGALTWILACALNAHMADQTLFNWNPDKNQLLIRERGISFERIVFEISSGNELTVLEHPNQEKYPGQRVSMVQVDDYVYAVPFIESDTEIFLKTIIPSRKATKRYRSTS